MENVMDQQEAEKIGRLLATVETLHARQDEIMKRLDSLEKTVADKFRTAEIVFKILKFLGLAAIALISLKFGDIPRLWSHFF